MKKIITYGAAAISILLAACVANNPNPTTPLPASACAKLAYLNYMCEDGSPGQLTQLGKGDFKGQVISHNHAQFVQGVMYWPYSFPTPQLFTYNNTQFNYHAMIPGSGPTQPDTWYFDVPATDSYMVWVSYTEYGTSGPFPGNTATCSNPSKLPWIPVACYKWAKILHLAKGFVPDCGMNFVVAVGDEGPLGFIGYCGNP